ncbi:MAG: biotin synthase BioB [Candidatus Lernaella stagnicola]|nr:biotin synthase BioB [Candidatus Lernaella stagnicola]
MMDAARIDRLLAGEALTAAEALAVAILPETDFAAWLEVADLLRRRFAGPAVSLCAIVNAKSGGCDQDCSFCAQSGRYETSSPEYAFLDPETIRETALRAKAGGARHFSLVTSGRGLTQAEVDDAVRGVETIAAVGLIPCASLGVLEQEALAALRAAGLVRYHHNLETARDFYPQVCSTRTYDDNVAVLTAARRVGLEVCAGCLFGLGESWQHRVDLLLDLRRLGVDSVPINFLIPIPGTPLAGRPRLSPVECLRILVVARLMLPRQEIRICGGRENLGDLEADMFRAGASGLMIGDLLTVKGPSADRDRQLLAALGLPVVEPL